MPATCSLCGAAIDHAFAPYQHVHRCGAVLLACAECCAKGTGPAAIQCEVNHECAGEGAREVAA